MSYDNRKRFIINFIYYGIIIALAFVVIRFSFRYLAPFIIAFAMAYCLRNVISKVASTLRIKRSIAAVICMALFYFVVLGLLGTVFFQLLRWRRNLFNALPEFYTEEIAPLATEILTDLREWLVNIDPEVESRVVDFTLQVLENLGNGVANISVSAVSWVSRVVSKVPSLVVSTLICVIASFFISADYYNITYAILRHLPQKQIDMLYKVEQSCKTAVKKFVKSYSIIMLITFTELSVGFLILRVNHRFLIAMATAILDIMPVFGTGGVLIPWAVISLMLGNYYLGIGLFVLYIIITIVRNVLEPRIVGKQVGLHPVVTLACMFVGMKLFGILGLIGLPIGLVVLKRLYAGEKSEDVEKTQKLPQGI